MKLLPDQGLPRSAAAMLRELGHDSVHAADIDMSRSSDQEILDRAAAESRVVVTLDADFHTLLALSGASRPSVIRIRIERLKAQECAGLVDRVTAACARDLETGAAVVVEPKGVRVRRLPFNAF